MGGSREGSWKEDGAAHVFNWKLGQFPTTMSLYIWAGSRGVHVYNSISPGHRCFDSPSGPSAA